MNLYSLETAVKTASVLAAVFAFLGTILGGSGQYGFAKVKADVFTQSAGVLTMDDASGFSCAIAAVVLQALAAVAHVYKAPAPVDLALKTPESQAAAATAV